MYLCELKFARDVLLETREGLVNFISSTPARSLNSSTQSLRCRNEKGRRSRCSLIMYSPSTSSLGASPTTSHEARNPVPSPYESDLNSKVRRLGDEVTPRFASFSPQLGSVCFPHKDGIVSARKVFLQINHKELSFLGWPPS